VIFFTPPQIVLYSNGLGNSQTVWLSPVQGEALTAAQVPRRRLSVSPKSAGN